MLMPCPAYSVQLRILFGGHLKGRQDVLAVDGKADKYCLLTRHPAILTPFYLYSLPKPLQPDNTISYFPRATEEANFLPYP